jgi:hypothetical protein
MAAVPVILSGVLYPKNKKDPPVVGTFVGNAVIAGLEVGGGPIIPPDQLPEVPKPEPPLVIWGGPFDPPHPEHPIVLPDPPLPPIKPPVTPEPPHEGWNFSQAKSGWYYLYVPGEGEASPKRRP